LLMPKGLERPKATCHPERLHYAHGLCQSCDQKRRYQKHKGRYAEKVKEWAKNNPQKRKEIEKRYYLKNKDKARARVRKSYVRHKEKRNRESKEWRSKNSELLQEYARRYYKLHPEVKKASEAKRRAQKMGGGYSATPVERQWRIFLFGNRCAYCGGEYKHIDHVIPLARGGHDGAGNLVPSCKHCNHTKRIRNWIVWFREQEFYNKSREDFISKNIW